MAGDRREALPLSARALAVSFTSPGTPVGTAARIGLSCAPESPTLKPADLMIATALAGSAWATDCTYAWRLRRLPHSVSRAVLRAGVAVPRRLRAMACSATVVGYRDGVGVPTEWTERALREGQGLPRRAVREGGCTTKGRWASDSLTT